MLLSNTIASGNNIHKDSFNPDLQREGVDGGREVLVVEDIRFLVYY